eukprot:6189820-Pleurochrysis_carterae.AAC.1
MENAAPVVKRILAVASKIFEIAITNNKDLNRKRGITALPLPHRLALPSDHQKVPIPHPPSNSYLAETYEAAEDNHAIPVQTELEIEPQLSGAVGILSVHMHLPIAAASQVAPDALKVCFGTTGEGPGTVALWPDAKRAPSRLHAVASRPDGARKPSSARRCEIPSRSSRGAQCSQ